MSCFAVGLRDGEAKTVVATQKVELVLQITLGRTDITKKGITLQIEGIAHIRQIRITRLADTLLIVVRVFTVVTAI